MSIDRILTYYRSIHKNDAARFLERNEILNEGELLHIQGQTIDEHQIYFGLGLPIRQTPGFSAKTLARLAGVEASTLDLSLLTKQEENLRIQGDRHAQIAIAAIGGELIRLFNLLSSLQVSPTDAASFAVTLLIKQVDQLRVQAARQMQAGFGVIGGAVVDVVTSVGSVVADLEAESQARSRLANGLGFLSASVGELSKVVKLDPSVAALLATAGLAREVRQMHASIQRGLMTGIDAPGDSILMTPVPSLPHFAAVADGTQVFAHATATNVTFATTITDGLIDSTYGGTVLTIGTQDAGLGIMVGGIEFIGAGGASGVVFDLMKVSPPTRVARDNRVSPSSANLGCTVAFIDNFIAGDQYHFQGTWNAWTASGTNTPSVPTTRFSFAKISTV